MKINLGSGAIIQPIIKVEPPGRKLGNWLKAYGEYTAENEAPEHFHLWVALGMIAGASRRNVYLQMQHYDVLSNLFVILVAPAGTARKTTALKIGRNLLKDVPGVHFTTKSSSPAALIKQFSELPEKDQQSITCISYELGTFFSTNTADMVDLATDLYDGNPDWDKQTISRGMEKITRPWFNFLSGTTPQWLGDYLTATAVEGGFVSRSLFIYADKRKLSNPRPAPNPRLTELRRLLVNDLTHISTINGEFSLDEEAGEFYDAWYLDPKRFPQFPDARVSGYYERKHIHVLKVAMCLSMAERDERVITKTDVETALSLLESIEPGYHKSFSAVGKNLHATDMERILAQIAAAGKDGLGHGAVIAKNYHALDGREMGDIIAQLLGAGYISIAPGNKYVATMGGVIGGNN